jgi:hypothetical protein
MRRRMRREQRAQAAAIASSNRYGPPPPLGPPTFNNVPPSAVTRGGSGRGFGGRNSMRLQPTKTVPQWVSNVERPALNRDSGSTLVGSDELIGQGRKGENREEMEMVERNRERMEGSNRRQPRLDGGGWVVRSF